MPTYIDPLASVEGVGDVNNSALALTATINRGNLSLVPPLATGAAPEPARVSIPWWLIVATAFVIFALSKDDR